MDRRLLVTAGQRLLARTLLPVLLATVLAASAYAAIGDIKPGTPFVPTPTGNGRALAFSESGGLYYTVTGDPNIYRATTGGVSLGPIPLAGRNFTCGALSWDASSKQLWCGAYDGSGNVWTVDTATGVATFKFSFAFAQGESCYPQPPGFIDGLAFDPSDGTLWLSDDAATKVYHVTAAGVVLSSFTTPNHPDTGTPGCNTGITVAPGGHLELAMQAGPDTAPHVIVKVKKAAPGTIVVSFVARATNPGIEDIEFDGKTFAPRCAVWTNQFGPATLTAFDVQCTRTLGYWKTHSADAVPFLPITLGTPVCTTVADADDVEQVLKDARANDAKLMLAAQLLTAKLNVAMGDIPAADLAAITPVITAADALLGKNSCNPDTGRQGVDRAQATMLIAQLDAFNNMYAP